jgi:hypothetical protein
MVLGLAGGVFVIIAAVFVLLQRDGNDGESADGGGEAKAFYTIDEGKTWFLDDVSKLPPFPKDGKEAVRAYVYKCPNGTEFVAFLERYTAEGRKKREAAIAGGGNGAPLLDQAAGIEVKAPGQVAWVRQSDARAVAIMSPKCPNGERAQMVLP